MTFHLSEVAEYLSNWRMDIWLQFIFLVITFIISIVAFVSFYFYKKFHIENTTFHTIENLYGLFHKLSISYNDWRLSHLFCITEKSYVETCEKVMESFSLVTDNAQLKVILIEHQLREENMIVNILLFYEQVFYQYKHSKNLSVRKEFLKLIDRYFKERLLVNPRIVHFILSSHVGKELHLEEEAILSLADKYEIVIRNDHGKIYRDTNGPFCLDIIVGKKKINLNEPLTLDTFIKWRQKK